METGMLTFTQFPGANSIKANITVKAGHGSSLQPHYSGSWGKGITSVRSYSKTKPCVEMRKREAGRLAHPAQTNPPNTLSKKKMLTAVLLITSTYWVLSIQVRNCQPALITKANSSWHTLLSQHLQKLHHKNHSLHMEKIRYTETKSLLPKVTAAVRPQPVCSHHQQVKMDYLEYPEATSSTWKIFCKKLILLVPLNFHNNHISWKK